MVINPAPAVFKYAFVTLETDTDLLQTSWGNNYRTLTIYLPEKVCKIEEKRRNFQYESSISKLFYVLRCHLNNIERA